MLCAVSCLLYYLLHFVVSSSHLSCPVARQPPTSNSNITWVRSRFQDCFTVNPFWYIPSHPSHHPCYKNLPCQNYKWLPRIRFQVDKPAEDASAEEKQKLVNGHDNDSETAVWGVTSEIRIDRDWSKSKIADEDLAAARFGALRSDRNCVCNAILIGRVNQVTCEGAWQLVAKFGHQV